MGNNARTTPNRAARRRRPPVTARPPEPGREALEVPEAAWVLHLHPNSVGNLIRSGQLASFTVGRRRLIARSAIEEFIARGGTEGAA
jgi:excisionase family DNA binding protein